MHELSVALTLVEVAGRHLRGPLRGRPVDAVHLRLGPLAGVAKEALLFSFDAAARGTALEGARLVIEDVPVVVFCARCRTERAIGEPLRLRCPVCGTLTPEITQGGDLELTALEVRDDAAPDR